MSAGDSVWLTPDDARIDTASATGFTRLWQTFATARLTLGLVLLLMELGMLWADQNASKTAVGFALSYFLLVLITGKELKPQPLSEHFDPEWGKLVGLDAVAFALLQWAHGSNLNFTPLFALPVLLASILGTRMLAMGTAAGVTLLLLISHWTYANALTEAHSILMQTALSGIGYFAISLLANELASRILFANRQIQRSNQQAEIQRHVNALVIKSMPEGVLIVDQSGTLRAINPAGRFLLGPGLNQAEHPDLLALVYNTFASKGPLATQFTLPADDSGSQRTLLARTQLTTTHTSGTETLCVVFLLDLREQEARVRTEKLASMGRMSAALAHEIRNPLSAIVQANGLLEEELQAPHQQRMTGLIAQNARRLEKIVDDILNASRLRPSDNQTQEVIELQDWVTRIGLDWAQHHHETGRLHCVHHGQAFSVQFDPEHLRQILVNLLDNARRYASHGTQSIQIHTEIRAEHGVLEVWSDGAPLDASVQSHLFEPFFSTESRSSGLGLFICRELCERNHATLQFERCNKMCGDTPKSGNSFCVLMPLHIALPDASPETPRQATLLT